MKNCLVCDEPAGDSCFRIRVGGVEHDIENGTQFAQTLQDCFEDGTYIKWLCRRCAENAELFIDELKLDDCQAPEGTGCCNCDFEPLSSEDSGSVLRIEWGQVVTSNKGPGEMFVSEAAGHVHFNCACDGWGLPLYSLDPQDCP